MSNIFLKMLLLYKCSHSFIYVTTSTDNGTSACVALSIEIQFTFNSTAKTSLKGQNTLY